MKRLFKRVKAIEYEYDFNRLVRIAYPDSADVVYTYGDNTANFRKDNRVGRIVTVVNGDMMEERFYGDLGETVKTIKSIRSEVPSRMWPVFTTRYVFDYFGRMRQLVYPDGEVLTYTYDRGGLLSSARGVKGGTHYEYLTDLAYDEFGQRVRMKLGNGVETSYQYDPETRRLSHILTKGADGSILQNQSYLYDPVGNITETANQPFVTRDLTSRSVQQSYDYDDLHRLIEASGTYQVGGTHIDRYSNDFVYDTIGNFETKKQRHWYEDPLTGEESIRPRTTYSFTYQYKGAQPHAVTNVGGHTYHYDDNGNLTRRVNDQTGQVRQIHWNEEDRITRILDQGRETVFRYDDAGMRIFKRGKYGETIYIDPNFSLRNGEVGSKHIFAGSTRLATKMVMKENRTGASKKTYIRPPGGKEQTDQGKAPSQGQEKQLDKDLQKENSGKSHIPRERRTESPHGKGQDKVKPNDAVLPGQRGLENALRHGQGNKTGIYRRLDRLGYEVDRDGRIVPRRGEGDDEGGDEDGDSDPYPGDDGFIGDNYVGPTIPQEHQIWYYHGDHLGSSTVITDRFGRNYEHLQYFPYGETWVEEKRSQTNLPFRFTGKELDPETGLYYFGARYYDPVVGVWVSVDPILIQYLKGEPAAGIYQSKNLAMFSYGHLNPIANFDPDGNFSAKAQRSLRDPDSVTYKIEMKSLPKGVLKSAGVEGARQIAPRLHKGIRLAQESVEIADRYATGESVSFKQGENVSQRLYQFFSESRTDRLFAQMTDPDILKRLLSGGASEDDFMSFLLGIQNTYEYDMMNYLPPGQFIQETINASDEGIIGRIGNIKSGGISEGDNKSPFRWMVERAGENKKILNQE